MRLFDGIPAFSRPSRSHAVARRLLTSAGAVTFILLLAALAPSARLGVLAGSLGSAEANAQTTSGTPAHIRVAYLPILIGAPLFIAEDKGYFAQEGVSVEYHELWQASDILAGIVAGEIDAGLGGFGPAHMNAASRGLDLRIVAPLHTERPPVATPLVVRKELWESGEVRTVSDLRGKRVAINSKGSATEYWLWSALGTGGLTPNDVDVQILPFPDAVVALGNGALDAAMLNEPFPTLGERQGVLVRLAEDFISDFQVTAVYYTGQFADEHRDAGERFLRAYLRGARDLEGNGYHTPENLAILEKWTKVPADVIADARPPFHDPEGRVHVQDFQQLYEFFLAQGVLNVTAPLDFSTIVDPSFAEAARRAALMPVPDLALGG
ncbi:MAG: ABC transporter substrate-binding protein [Chloroflexi bacterium]|nr:ABC transporter substrate-binding protein [Chloroflexota bacterium]